MREVKVSDLSGVELEWAFGMVMCNRQYVHELDESLLYLVDLEEVRRTNVKKCEATQNPVVAEILIERGLLNVSYEDSVFRITGIADLRPYGDNPRSLSGFGVNLPEAVARAICSYHGDKFDIPSDVARLHDRRIEADKKADLQELIAGLEESA